MAIQQIGFLRSYIGLSSDTKPVTTLSDTIPPGSMLRLTDSEQILTWDGYRWTVPRVQNDVAGRLDLILEELKAIRELHENVVTSL